MKPRPRLRPEFFANDVFRVPYATRAHFQYNSKLEPTLLRQDPVFLWRRTCSLLPPGMRAVPYWRGRRIVVPALRQLHVLIPLCVHMHMYIYRERKRGCLNEMRYIHTMYTREPELCIQTKLPSILPPERCRAYSYGAPHGSHAQPLERKHGRYGEHRGIPSFRMLSAEG